MAQGKLKQKVKIPDGVKTKSVHRTNIAKKGKKNRPKKAKHQDSLQKEVEKEIRKKIENNARSQADR